MCESEWHRNTDQPVANRGCSTSTSLILTSQERLDINWAGRIFCTLVFLVLL